MSQETRTATIIANHVNENVRFETDATTFGELKQEEQAHGLFDGNVRVIVRETRNELSMKDSKLPNGGFTLIVVADKVKSGMSDRYDDMERPELIDEATERDIETEDVSVHMIRALLREDDEKAVEEAQDAASGQSQEERAEKFEEMKSRIEDAVDNCRKEVVEIMEEYVDILPDSVIPDYSDTIKEIKSELGLN